MLILVCVEQKEKVQGVKWGGLLPISSFVSRHCSGVSTGGARRAPWACLRIRPRTCTRARWAVPREACRDRPLLVLCRERVGSPCVATGVFRVATGFYGSWVLVSRHSLGVAIVMLRRGLVSCRDMTFVSQQRRFQVD